MKTFSEFLNEVSYKTLQSYKDKGGKTEKGVILATNKMRKANDAGRQKTDYLHPELGAQRVGKKYEPKIAASAAPKPSKRKKVPLQYD